MVTFLFCFFIDLNTGDIFPHTLHPLIFHLSLFLSLCFPFSFSSWRSFVKLQIWVFLPSAAVSSALSPTNWDNFGPPWPNTPEKGSWNGWLCGPIGHSPLIFHLYKISIYISLEFNLIGMPPHRVQSGKVIITDHL